MKIIVLTPIKNEEWILSKYLEITSLFADHIIIADQDSKDRSKEIAKKFEKVILIENNKKGYDEAERQILLINKARELFGTGNLLLALDADEIITASGISSTSWDIIRQSDLGTVFFFDKPTLAFDKPYVFRYGKGFPLGYLDDGANHQPDLIHSTRIPYPMNAPVINIEDIEFLHLCFVRENVQFSKNRYYCALENINKTNVLRLRNKRYRYFKSEDYIKENKLHPIQDKWLSYPNHVELKNFKQQKYYYSDYEVLKLFQKYGTKRFFSDPIWNIDWEDCRKEAKSKGVDNIPNEPIQTPSKLRRASNNIFFAFIKNGSKILKTLVNLMKQQR
ncbi:MAG: glycosyltransferase family 2 protein [Bacteroidota bacterium]